MKRLYQNSLDYFGMKLNGSSKIKLEPNEINIKYD